MPLLCLILCSAYRSAYRSAQRLNPNTHNANTTLLWLNTPKKAMAWPSKHHHTPTRKNSNKNFVVRKNFIVRKNFVVRKNFMVRCSLPIFPLQAI